MNLFKVGGFNKRVKRIPWNFCTYLHCCFKKNFFFKLTGEQKKTFSWIWRTTLHRWFNVLFESRKRAVKKGKHHIIVRTTQVYQLIYELKIVIVKKRLVKEKFNEMVQYISYCIFIIWNTSLSLKGMPDTFYSKSVNAPTQLKNLP